MEAARPTEEAQRQQADVGMISCFSTAQKGVARPKEWKGRPTPVYRVKGDVCVQHQGCTWQ